MLDPETYAKRVIELHGGHNRFFALMDERFEKFNAVWRQDSDSIGRVLRAYLAAEHFLTEFIVERNPGLVPIDKARLAFSQKVELLPDDDPSVSFIKPGLRRLNTIRNRMAHRLRVEITSDDRSAFLGIQMFAAMREESAKREGPKPDDPLSILEQFALFASSLLHGGSTPERDLWRKAAGEQLGDAHQTPAGDSQKAASEE